jgi:amidohydrolase
MSLIMQRTHAALKNLETLYQVKVAITKDRNGVAAERSPEAECIAAKAIATILGEKYLVKELTTPGGDDFHYYRYHQPELKATMIGVGCDLAPGLHHPYMQFNQEAIFTGINIMKEILNDFAKTE